MQEPRYNLRLLRIFLAVVRHQGFTAAQQELKMSTSAISTYMAQLEAQLGVALCNRGRAGFSLTSAGEMIHREAQEIFARIEQFEEYVADLKGELRGRLAVGLLDSMLSEPKISIVDLLGSFTSEHPQVHLNLRILSPFELQHEVLESRLDLAIGSLPTRLSGLNYLFLYQERHALYCSDRHPLFREEAPSLAEVTRQRLIGRGYWSQSEAERHGFQAYSATVESMEAELILILSGSYIGYLPEHLAERWVRTGQLRQLLPGTCGYAADFSAIVRRGRTREPLIQTLRERIKRTFQLP